MKRAPKDKDWQNFLEGLPLFPEAPEGFLNVPDYAARASASKPGVTRAVKTGKINKEHCITVGKKRHLFINWNETAYDYIVAKNEKFWPADFKQNEEKIYKPLDAEVDELEIGVAQTPAQASQDGLQLKKVTDINSAKYRAEQLKIMKMQAELRLANNESVLLADVIAANRETGLETKAAIKKAINKMCPKLATAKTVLECRAILDKYLYEALETLIPFTEGVASDGETEEKN